MFQEPVAVPHACPRCSEQSGTAFKFAADAPGTRRVLLRCENCGHRWSVIEPIPAAAPIERG